VSGPAPNIPGAETSWLKRRWEDGGKGFADFVRIAWPQVDKSPYVHNWHIEAMVEHLEAVTRREITDLVIDIPPACSKSSIVSVLWPAWEWIENPGAWWIAVSYGKAVALRDARKQRALIQSDWYRKRWPHIKLETSKKASTGVSEWNTTAGGRRYTSTVRGQVMGMHGDTAIIDDPIDPFGVESPIELQEVLDFWHGTLPTRFRFPTRAARVCVMQRLHMKDLAGEMIREGATVLCLPMRYERRHPNVYAKDPRKTDGELLNPARYPEENIRKLEKVLGPSRTASQLQQRPAPEEGNIFKKVWFQYWTLLPEGGTWALSIDCAFKATDESSFVVIQVWYLHGTNLYLVDQVRRRMDFADTCEAIATVAQKYPRAHRKLIEAKANGPAVVSLLKNKISGFEEIEPQGSKEGRAYAAQPIAKSGNVYLPDPDKATYPDGRVGASWVNTSEVGDPTSDGFVGEVTTFPNAGTDDQLDAMTQAINVLAPYSAEDYKRKVEEALKYWAAA
jgi:predicted phage terminase large subunit-like protein